MSHKSWIRDDVSRHFNTCLQCKSTDAENIRVNQPAALRRTVPEAVLVAMCLDGRAIYRSYLFWLAEPDE